MKHICITTLALSAGGAERFVSELANYWGRENEVKISVVLLFKKEIFYDINANVRVYEPTYTASNKKIVQFFQLWKYLRKTVKKINPDTIFNVGYNSLTVFLLLGLGYPLYISNRSNPLKKRPLWYRVIRYIMYSIADGMLVQTSVAQKQYSEVTANKNIIIIPNFVRKITSIANIEKKNQIISLSRFIKSKNLPVLIKVFSSIKNKSWKLVLVGDGPERKTLEEVANKYHVKERVIFTGYQKNVDKYLQESKVFAFSSLSEGYPNALLEAMASPLPVVSYNCNAGPADLIQDGVNGFLVPLHDEELFTEKISLLVKNEELRKRISSEAVKVRNSNSIDFLAKKIKDFLLEKSKK